MDRDEELVQSDCTTAKQIVVLTNKFLDGVWREKRLKGNNKHMIFYYKFGRMNGKPIPNLGAPSW